MVLIESRSIHILAKCTWQPDGQDERGGEGKSELEGLTLHGNPLLMIGRLRCLVGFIRDHVVNDPSRVGGVKQTPERRLLELERVLQGHLTGGVDQFLGRFPAMYRGVVNL
jgi:hypothetical protein